MTRLRRTCATATALVALAVAAGCGSDEPAAGGGDSPDAAQRARTGQGLVWKDRPQVVAPENLPNDRILVGRIVNDSTRVIELEDREVKLTDDRGGDVFRTVRFSSGFGRDIYPPRYGHRLPDRDRIRLGYRAVTEPGGVRPVTIAWRLGERARSPVRVELAGARLVVPPVSPSSGG